MSTLVLVEHDNHKMHPGTRHVLSAALSLAKPVTLLVAGEHCAQVAKEAATLSGVDKVLLVDDPNNAHPLAEPIADLLVQIASSYTALLAPASTFGKNILPRAAALLDVAQVSDVTKIVDASTFEHPIYAGNAIETVRVLDAIKVLTIRTTAFSPVAGEGPACPIENLQPVSVLKAKFVRHVLSESKRPDLGSAKIVVSGGRGLQDAKRFQLIEQLADALGAAVGASRAAVDAGFISNDYQVGQTGRIVAPLLYIAIGISGAVQHLAGMKDAKVIVAINKDADAPIFQIATYGLVGDLFEIVPQLIDLLNNRK
jgi:electron transfer flavoprotein alpha subunit